MLDIVDVVEVVEGDDTVASSIQFLERLGYDPLASFGHGRLETIRSITEITLMTKKKIKVLFMCYPNCFEELVYGNRSGMVFIEGVEESTTSIDVHFDSTFLDAFAEFFETQSAIAIIIHPAEYSIFFLSDRNNGCSLL